jgi:hypothetical protein
VDPDKLDELVDQGAIGNPHLTPEQNKRLIRSIVDHGNIASGQMLQWVRITAYYTEKVAKVGREATGAEFTVFWLRLYGLFQEVRANFAESLNTFEDASAGKQVSPELLGHMDRLRISLAALAKAMELLSEDDLLYLKYRRDCEAHVWQDAYRLRVTRGGKNLREKQTVFGRDWPIDELNERIRQMLVKYQVSEDSIAVDFARRLHPVMPEVLAACERYCAAQ